MSGVPIYMIILALQFIKTLVYNNCHYIFDTIIILARPVQAFKPSISQKTKDLLHKD